MAENERLTEARREKVVSAFLSRAAQARALHHVSLVEIARDAGVKLGLLRDLDGMRTLVDWTESSMDGRAVVGIEPRGEEESVRDYLFDLVMRRFEAMEPHRQAFVRIAQSDDAALLAARAGWTLRSARWLLLCAGVRTTGAQGWIRLAGFSRLLGRTHAAWLLDTEGDMARTMATLDRGLREGAEAMQRLDGVMARLRGGLRPLRPEGEVRP